MKPSFAAAHGNVDREDFLVLRSTQTRTVPCLARSAKLNPLYGVCLVYGRIAFF